MEIIFFIISGLGIAIRKSLSGNPAESASFYVYRIRDDFAEQFTGSGKLKKMHTRRFLGKILALLHE